MPDYPQTRDTLVAALSVADENGPEWIKLKAAIAALDDAAEAESRAAFGTASLRLEDAAAKLEAIIGGLQAQPAWVLLERARSALHQVNALSEGVDNLLSGEPASALPGMDDTNRASFPSPNEPIVPPMRGLARFVNGQDGQPQGPASVQRMVADILRREGGYANHPNDRGGPTRYGITLRTLANWRRRGVDAEDVRNLSVQEAEKIYLANYFTGPRINRLPERLQPLLFDMSINHGPATAVKVLQRTLCEAGFRCVVDGGIGEETIGAARGADQSLGKLLVNRLVENRIALYHRIASGDRSQRVFLAGWMKRANEFRQA